MKGSPREALRNIPDANSPPPRPPPIHPPKNNYTNFNILECVKEAEANEYDTNQQGNPSSQLSTAHESLENQTM